MLVNRCGKPPTESVPSRISAMPRYMVRVPIVTAIDGSPSRVTRTPFSAPPSTPTTRQVTMHSPIGQPLPNR